MKKNSIQRRTETENKILAFPIGAILGACVSPLAWWAFQVPGWKEGLALTGILALLFGLVSAFACATKAEKIFSFIIRLLNP